MSALPASRPSARPRATTVLLVTATALAAAGAIVNLWRPLAPPPLGTPTDLTSFDPALLARVAAYRGSQRAVGALGLLLGVAVPLTLAVRASARRRLGALVPGNGALAAALAGVVVVLVTDLVTLPGDVWVGWFHERTWGFASGSLGLWLRDRLVSVALRGAGVGVGLSLLWWLVHARRHTWHLWLVMVATAAAAVLVLLQPLVVQPLFLTTRPLEAGPTRDAVAQVLDRAGEADLEIEIGDASTRTTRVNAFVTGLGPSRRVVLYDTLLALPTDEVAYVVAHELAHREHRDLPRGVLLTATAALPVAWLLRRLLERASPERVQPAGLATIAIATLTVATLLGAPVTNLVSRRSEAAADHRALALTQDAQAQIDLHRRFVDDDLADPRPPAWVMQLWGTHPTVAQRIQAAVDGAVRADLPLPVARGG